MTWFPDLSPCTYHDWPGDRLSIGWLERGRSFSTGRIEPALRESIFVDTLVFAATQRRSDQFRGYHRCDLCERPPGDVLPTSVDIDGESRLLGSANVEAVAAGGDARYVAPDLIVHYVIDHAYRPPDAFVDAVILGTMAGEPRDVGRVTPLTNDPDRQIDDHIVGDLVFDELAGRVGADRSSIQRSVTLSVSPAGRTLASIPEVLPSLLLFVQVNGPHRRDASGEWAPTEAATAATVDGMIERDPILLDALLESVTS